MAVRRGAEATSREASSNVVRRTSLQNEEEVAEQPCSCAGEGSEAAVAGKQDGALYKTFSVQRFVGVDEFK